MTRAELEALIDAGAKRACVSVLERLPDFALDEGAVVEYPNWSMIGGWAAIPVTFTPGAKG